jgi:hypothetical protein
MMICAAKRLVCCTTARTVKGIRMDAEKPRNVTRSWLSSAASDRAVIGSQRVRVLNVVTINILEGHEDAKLSAKQSENSRACFW